jgi:hypothetical protein
MSGSVARFTQTLQHDEAARIHGADDLPHRDQLQPGTGDL